MTIAKVTGHAQVWRQSRTASSQAVWVWASIVFTGFVALFQAIAGEPPSEISSKAKFLINFAEFTEWPDGTFADKEELFKIGILGRDPFGTQLDELAKNDQLKGRRARILRSRRVEELKSCHILYISQSEESRLERILRGLKEKPVLTVSEIESSASRGAIIQMKTENEKVRLLINLESAKAANLVIKSKLLRLGEIVESTKK
jgi:hypothetical protein